MEYPSPMKLAQQLDSLPDARHTPTEKLLIALELYEEGLSYNALISKESTLTPTTNALMVC